MLLIDSQGPVISFTISAGQLGIVTSLGAIGGLIWRLTRKLDRLIWEHDLMWIDYAQRKGIPIDSFRSLRKWRPSEVSNKVPTV